MESNRDLEDVIDIKYEPFEFEDKHLEYYQQLKNEIVHDEDQDYCDPNNDLTNDSRHEPIEYSNEEIEPELGFSTEDIKDSKKILKSYRNSFKDKSFLRKPLQLHQKDKQPLCSKSFSESSKLITHLQTHSQVKPYSCKVCKERFISKTRLTRHLQSHSGDKPKFYQCFICEKKFTQNGNLVRHLRIHSGDKIYHCNVCKKSFTQKAHLTNHLIIHSGVKPYSCDICKKSFAISSYLTNHLRIHAGDNLYQCAICTKAFSRNATLIKHSRTHSGKNHFIAIFVKRTSRKRQT